MTDPKQNWLSYIPQDVDQTLSVDYFLPLQAWSLVARDVRAHMSNTLDWIPVDKTWSPLESGRRMKPEVPSSPLELPEV